MGRSFSVSRQLLLVTSRVAAIASEIADILIAVAAIAISVANVSTQVLLVPASLADILAALLARGIMPDLSRVLPQLAAILTNVSVVAAKLAGVLMDITPVGAKIARFAMRHARVQRRVRVVDVLCAYELRTSNEQGCGNGSHSEIAHGFSQRQYRALAVMACAAYTTVACSPTLSANIEAIWAASFSESFFPLESSHLETRTRESLFAVQPAFRCARLEGKA